MAEQPEVAPIENDEPEDTPGYKAPAQKTLDEIQNLDADDESLVKYKQTLLAGAEEKLDEGGDNVLMKKLLIKFTDGKNYELDISGDVSNLKKTKLVFKEGTTYNVFLQFRVQREIVTGLKYHQNVYRKGVRVDKNSYMAGSYGPKKDSHEYKSPPDDVPSGMIARGTYTVKSKFTDDDKNSILEWEWSFDIKKDWE